MSDIHFLIKSMSKNEKRYFRLLSSTFYNDDTVYQKLFEEIEASETYDEKQLRQKLEIKHFAYTKKYLFDNILKALRMYHTEQRETFQMIDAFKNISILRNKGMIKEAVKMYEKTEEQFLEQNLYAFLVELLNLGELLYKMHLPNKDVEEKILSIERDQRKYNDYQRDILEYRTLSKNLRRKWRKVYPIRNEEQEQEMLELLNHNTLLQSDQKVLNPVAKSFYDNSMMFCHSVLLNFEEVKRIAQDSVELLLQDKKPSSVQRKGLLATMSNLLVVCAKTKDNCLFEKYNKIYLEKMKEFQGKDGAKIDMIHKKLYYNYTLQNLIENQLFENILELEEEVKKFWESFQDFLDLDWKTTVSNFFAQANFQFERFDQAQKWIEIILKEEKNNPKTPLVCNTRILNLLIHFKQKNYFLLHSLFRSTFRYLNKNDRLFKSERLLLNYFKWVGNNYEVNNFEDKTQKLFVDLQKAIEGNKYENNFYEELKLSINKAFAT